MYQGTKIPGDVQVYLNILESAASSRPSSTINLLTHLLASIPCTTEVDLQRLSGLKCPTMAGNAETRPDLAREKCDVVHFKQVSSFPGGRGYPASCISPRLPCLLPCKVTAAFQDASRHGTMELMDRNTICMALLPNTSGLILFHLSKPS